MDDAGDEGPDASCSSAPINPPHSAASHPGSIPTAGGARWPDSEPVSWFLFADALQVQFPALISVATAIALDDAHPHGFVLAGPQGDSFAVRRDAVLGRSWLSTAGETRGISWRAVVCSTTCRGGQEQEDTAVPAGPYVVLTKTTTRGYWPAFLCSVADDGSLAPSNGLYVIDALEEYVGSSLRAFFVSIDEVGGYRALATPDGCERDGHTWRIVLESGQARPPAHRRHSSSAVVSLRGAEAEQSSSHRRRRRRFEEKRRALTGVVWCSSSAPSRPPSQRGRSRWDERPQPVCSSCHGRVEEPVDRMMTCCRAVLCRGCAEVNPCGCPEWQNRRGFPVPILTDYHIDDDENCVVEDAIMLRRPTWQQFYAKRTGENVSYGFYNVEDAYHRRERGVRYQIHRYEMMAGGRRWRRLHCLSLVLRTPSSAIAVCNFSFPPFADYTPPLLIALMSSLS